jgi:hypothetical protein
VAIVWALRIALYVQLLLGFDRLTTYVRLITGGAAEVAAAGGGRITQDLHLTLGIIVAALALYVFRPVAGVPNIPLRTAARFLPLAPLALGLGFRFAGLANPALIALHVILAFATIGCVEVAAARQRRAMAGGE